MKFPNSSFQESNIFVSISRKYKVFYRTWCFQFSLESKCKPKYLVVSSCGTSTPFNRTMKFFWTIREGYVNRFQFISFNSSVCLLRYSVQFTLKEFSSICLWFYACHHCRVVSERCYRGVGVSAVEILIRNLVVLQHILIFCVIPNIF